MANSSVKLYRDKDARLSFLKNKTVGIIGYGSQGRAQASCLRDSGLNVLIGLPPKSKSRAIGQKDGFEVLSVTNCIEKSDLICFLFPDHLHQEVFQEQI